MGVWGNAPIGFPEGEDDGDRVRRAQQGLAPLSAILIAKINFSTSGAPPGAYYITY